jgi:hypothetical protein
MQSCRAHRTIVTPGALGAQSNASFWPALYWARRPWPILGDAQRGRRTRTAGAAPEAGLLTGNGRLFVPRKRVPSSDCVHF